MSVIETVEQLEAIYGVTNDASIVKVADHVTPALSRLHRKGAVRRARYHRTRGDRLLAARRSLRLRPHS
ncbi:hypothetical protein ACVWZ6_009245 [Bradyrhizobium sp. GM6.1]